MRFLLGLILGAVAAVAVLIVYPMFDGDEAATVTAPLPASARDVRVVFGPEALAEILRESVAHSETPNLIGIAAVEMGDGVFTVRGTIPRESPNVRASITLSPSVETGAVRMRVVSANLGLLPVPPELARLIERPLNERLRATAGDVPYAITGVHAGPAGIEVTVRLDVSKLQGRAAP
jgi:hypothetical protein